MQENYLKYLILESKKFAKSNNIFDIILYGSKVKGKLGEGDIDILLIFNNEKLKKRTETSQNFKEKMKKGDKLDIKTINLNEMFEKDFLARQGVLIEGYSLLYNVEFSKRIGFIGYSLFTYNLKKLDHNAKTKFTYALIGRRKEQGVLKKINAIPLGRGAVKVPIKNSLIFEEFLQKWDLNYTKKEILEAA